MLLEYTTHENHRLQLVLSEFSGISRDIHGTGRRRRRADDIVAGSDVFVELDLGNEVSKDNQQSAIEKVLAILSCPIDCAKASILSSGLISRNAFRGSCDKIIAEVNAFMPSAFVSSFSPWIKGTYVCVLCYCNRKRGLTSTASSSQRRSPQISGTDLCAA